MPVTQAPPGAVPFVKIGNYSPLQVTTFCIASRQMNKACKLQNPNCLYTTTELVAAVMKERNVAEDDVIQAIEELRGDATLFMLPNGRLRFDSYDSH